MKRVLSYGKPYIWIILLVIVMKLAAAVLDLMIPSALADIINITILAGGTRAIIMSGLKMLAFAATEMVINCAANVISSKIANRMVGTMRQDLFEKVTKRYVTESGFPILVKACNRSIGGGMRNKHSHNA